MVRRVLAFGTFDLVHKGHEHYLKEAKKRGQVLIVVVARDETIEEVKGKKPEKNEKERLKDVKAMGIADKVVLGKKLGHNNFEIVEEYNANVIALGYDQMTNYSEIKRKAENLSKEIEVVRIGAFEPEKYKSSLLKKTIAK